MRLIKSIAKFLEEKEEGGKTLKGERGFSQDSDNSLLCELSFMGVEEGLGKIPCKPCPLTSD